MLQLATAERVRWQEEQPRMKRQPRAEPPAVTAETWSMPAPSRSTGRSLFIDATQRETGRAFQSRTARGRGFNEQ